MDAAIYQHFNESSPEKTRNRVQLSNFDLYQVAFLTGIYQAAAPSL
jgi:hypothetical protein